MIFQISIFALITCFYIAYFTKQIFLRKKGIHTNRLAKGRKPPKTAAIETALLAATYGIAAIQYASVFFSRFMLSLSFPVSVRWIGIALTGGGVIFFVLAITSMRDSWRAGVDETQKTSIVTRGIYKVSRNPAFVGFDLLYDGIVPLIFKKGKQKQQGYGSISSAVFVSLSSLFYLAGVRHFSYFLQ